MATEAVDGTHWTDDELDAIVADYFAMLAADLAGQRYVKSHHNAMLRERIQRSQSSVEYKHRNISAVLSELGMDWLPGYRPAVNYQTALINAVDRYLSNQSFMMDLPAPAYRSDTAKTAIFVPPPPILLDTRKTPRLQQLIRKFDPVERDRLNRALGRAGEELVLEVERERLVRAGKQQLA